MRLSTKTAILFKTLLEQDEAGCYEIGRYSGRRGVIDNLADLADQAQLFYGYDGHNDPRMATIVFYGSYPHGINAEQKMDRILKDAGVMRDFQLQTQGAPSRGLSHEERLPRVF